MARLRLLFSAWAKTQRALVSAVLGEDRRERMLGAVDVEVLEMGLKDGLGRQDSLVLDCEYG